MGGAGEGDAPTIPMLDAHHTAPTVFGICRLPAALRLEADRTKGETAARLRPEER